MSKQLELDINHPSWIETNFRSEIKGLWSVRSNTSSTQSTKESVLGELESTLNENNEHAVTVKEQ